MRFRLYCSLAVYAALALLATFTLDGGTLRNAVWIAMAAFAVKTLIAYKART